MQPGDHRDGAGQDAKGTETDTSHSALLTRRSRAALPSGS